MKLSGITVLITILCFSILTSCDSQKRQEERYLLKLHSSLENTADYEKNYITITQIQNILHQQGKDDELRAMLTEYADRHPQDPFNACYLFIAGKNHMDSGDETAALRYFSRILDTCQDVQYKGESIRFMCLRTILSYSPDLEKQAFCCRQLIEEFSSKINTGSMYFRLGEIYSAAEDWDNAASAYANFLNSSDAMISDNDIEYARNFTAYYSNDITWADRDLDNLLKNISEALVNAGRNRSTKELRKYMTKANFFMTSWEDMATSSEIIAADRLGSFLNSKIRVSSHIDKLSNSQEAYLKTEGWEYRINTWYLYFRKIKFPADPEKDGCWEWAGIYFGDRVYSKSNEY